MHVWGHACVAVICCACACGRYSVTLSVRCFRLLSSMCRSSEIDGRCVHLRGSDRCEISYAATLTWSMCRSTFEDPIGVNFIIMLLYSCTRITPRVCTLVLFIFFCTVLPDFYPTTFNSTCTSSNLKPSRSLGQMLRAMQPCLYSK